MWSFQVVPLVSALVVFLDLPQTVHSSPLFHLWRLHGDGVSSGSGSFLMWIGIIRGCDIG